MASHELAQLPAEMNLLAQSYLTPAELNRLRATSQDLHSYPMRLQNYINVTEDRLFEYIRRMPQLPPDNAVIDAFRYSIAEAMNEDDYAVRHLLDWHRGFLSRDWCRVWLLTHSPTEIKHLLSHFDVDLWQIYRTLDVMNSRRRRDHIETIYRSAWRNMKREIDLYRATSSF